MILVYFIRIGTFFEEETGTEIHNIRFERINITNAGDLYSTSAIEKIKMEIK